MDKGYYSILYEQLVLNSDQGMKTNIEFLIILKKITIHAEFFFYFFSFIFCRKILVKFVKKKCFF